MHANPPLLADTAEHQRSIAPFGRRAIWRAVGVGVVAVAITGLLLAATTASAATIEVSPGPSAINRAIDKAQDGDTLLIHDGTYRESLTIDKPVTLQGASDGRPVIDAGCKRRATIQVSHGHVRLKHLKVKGAARNPSGLDSSEIDIENVGTGIVRDVFVHDSCGGTDTGAEYGIKVFNSGAVKVTYGRATGGFGAAGIYLGAITDTGSGTLELAGTESFGNHQGVIVENSSGGRIELRYNYLRQNKIGGEEFQPTGLFIKNSDRVRVVDNEIQENGHFGVNLSVGSDHNALIDNEIEANGYATNGVDVNNNGSANCGSGNTGISTVAGKPLSKC
jgi:nitrous oxidase accessory protein